MPVAITRVTATDENHTLRSIINWKRSAFRWSTRWEQRSPLFSYGFLHNSSRVIFARKWTRSGTFISARRAVISTFHAARPFEKEAARREISPRAGRLNFNTFPAIAAFKPHFNYKAIATASFSWERFFFMSLQVIQKHRRCSNVCINRRDAGLCNELNIAAEKRD